MLLYGDPKVGKSFAALQLASALSTGGDWFGFQISQPRRVVYIQLDTPRSLWADRVAVLKASGLSTASIQFADRETLNTWPFDALEPAHQELLRANVDYHKPDVVILDTLRESHRGDENDSTDMQNVVSHLVAAVKPAALVLVSHGRKADPERGSSLINDNRGSNYVVGAVDAICHLSNKGIQIGGRAVDEVNIRVERQDNGTWALADRDQIKALARKILHDPSHEALSLRAKARLLAQQTGKEESTMLTVLYRLGKGDD